MKHLLILICSFLPFVNQAQIYTAKAGATNINFHSSAPMEDIEATNKGAIIVLKASTNEIQVRVTMQNFKFKNSLMEEHFNENYMETDKKVEVNGAATYPNRYAEFKGKINENIDYTKEGENKVTLTGKMNMHNVTRDVTIEGTLTKKGNELIINSKFPVKVADYNIKVPSMYVKNIAEVVDVTINSTLEPLKKN
jgi:polyisoprenoid-binding protein YceI